MLSVTSGHRQWSELKEKFPGITRDGWRCGNTSIWNDLRCACFQTCMKLQYLCTVQSMYINIYQTSQPSIYLQVSGIQSRGPANRPWWPWSVPSTWPMWHWSIRWPSSPPESRGNCLTMLNPQCVNIYFSILFIIWCGGLAMCCDKTSIPCTGDTPWMARVSASPRWAWFLADF